MEICRAHHEKPGRLEWLERKLKIQGNGPKSGLAYSWHKNLNTYNSDKCCGNRETAFTGTTTYATRLDHLLSNRVERGIHSFHQVHSRSLSHVPSHVSVDTLILPTCQRKAHEDMQCLHSGSRIGMSILNSPALPPTTLLESDPAHTMTLNGLCSSLNRAALFCSLEPQCQPSVNATRIYFVGDLPTGLCPPLSYLTSTLNLNVLYLFFTRNHKPEANE